MRYSSRADLPRELVLVEEDRRIGEVDHELRGVLQLDEQVFDVLRWSFMQVTT